MGDLSAPIRLSKEHKGRPRREPVWIGRYRIVGKDSARVLGKAWTKPIRRLTREGIADFRAGLTDRDLAASTLNQTRAIVRGIFALAVERYDLEDDVSIAFKRAKTRRATSEKISCYPPDEVMRLVAHAANEQDAALFLTAAFTGLRASELRGLRWRSVDFAGSLLHVERGFTDEGGEDLPKSYRVRSVPLMPQVALALTGLRRREYFTDDDELVFVNEVGDVLGYDSLVRRYRTAQKHAGVRRLRFHDLRHSFGTMAVRQFPITDVQTWMGHADIATTRKYIHYAPQPEAAAASARSSANSSARSQSCAASADQARARRREQANTSIESRSPSGATNYNSSARIRGEPTSAGSLGRGRGSGPAADVGSGRQRPLAGRFGDGEVRCPPLALQKLDRASAT